MDIKKYLKKINNTTIYQIFFLMLVLFISFIFIKSFLTGFKKHEYQTFFYVLIITLFIFSLLYDLIKNRHKSRYASNIYTLYPYRRIKWSPALLLFLIYFYLRQIDLEYEIDKKLLLFVSILFLIYLGKEFIKIGNNTIFSPINIYINKNNRKINFSQKEEVRRDDRDGFNIYMTYMLDDYKKISKREINKSIEIFNRFLYDSKYFNIMVQEHWWRITFSILSYFILFTFLIEIIEIAKEAFRFQNSSILMIISLSFLLFIISVPVRIMFVYKKKFIKKDDFDKIFLISIYFNRKFLEYNDSSFSGDKNILKELFLGLFLLLFSISIPVIINEVKTPTVQIEKNTKGESIEKK